MAEAIAAVDVTTAAAVAAVENLGRAVAVMTSRASTMAIDGALTARAAAQAQFAEAEALALRLDRECTAANVELVAAEAARRDAALAVMDEEISTAADKLRAHKAITRKRRIVTTAVANVRLPTQLSLPLSTLTPAAQATLRSPPTYDVMTNTPEHHQQQDLQALWRAHFEALLVDASHQFVRERWRRRESAHIRRRLPH